MKNIKNSILDQATCFFKILLDVCKNKIPQLFYEWRRPELFHEEYLSVSFERCCCFFDRNGYFISWKTLNVHISIEINENTLNTCIVNYKITPQGWMGFFSMMLLSKIMLQKIHQHSRKVLLYVYLNHNNLQWDVVGFDHLDNQPFFDRFLLKGEASDDRAPYTMSQKFWKVNQRKRQSVGNLRSRRIIVVPLCVEKKQLQASLIPPFHYVEEKEIYLEISIDAGSPNHHSSFYKKGKEKYVSIQIHVPICLISNSFTIRGYYCIYKSRLNLVSSLGMSLLKHKVAKWDIKSGGVHFSIKDEKRSIVAGVELYPRQNFSRGDRIPSLLTNPLVQVGLDLNTFDLNVSQKHLTYPVNRIVVMKQKQGHGLRSLYDWLSLQTGLSINATGTNSFLVSYMDVKTVSEEKIDLIDFQYRKEKANIGMVKNA